MRTILLFIILAFCLKPAFSSRNKPVHILDFELIGNNILIETNINSSSPLNLIFDTGVRNTIITELWDNDTISLNHTREINLHGLGEGEPLTTYLSTDNRLNIKGVLIDSATVYALKENIFQLSKHLGHKVNGMVGYDLLKDYIVRIDYSRKRIYLYEHENYTVNKRFREVPLLIENEKPYIIANVVLNGISHEVKLLLDTGAELPMWLIEMNFKDYHVPEKSIYTFIGQGLNGEIFGSVSRIDAVSIAGYSFKKPIVAFPDSSAISMILQTKERDGTMGSELLRRFHMVINYKDTTLYIRRNFFFNEKFSYNTTGIEVVQPFKGLPVYEIAELWKQSPAATAGLKVGDKIKSIDYKSVASMSLIEVKELLRKSSGTIRLNIERQQDNEIIYKTVKFKITKV